MHDARQIADELIRRNGYGTLTNMRLIKLNYLCHGWMLGLYGEPLSRQPVEAWQYGPIIPDVYYSLREHGATPVPGPIDFGYWGVEPREWNIRASRLLDNVLEIYGDRTGPQLSTLTRAPGSPWDQVWQPKRKSPATIPDSVIARYYREQARDAAIGQRT